MLPEDEACVAALSEAAAAQFALSGTIGRIGGEVIVTLNLLDTAKTESAGSASGTAPSLSAVADIIPTLLATTFGWSGAAAAKRYSLPQGKQVSFAVFDLKPLGIAPEVAANLTQVLAVALKSIDGTSVVSRDDIAAMLQLEASKVGVDCSDESCLAEIGGALGVDKLVVGNVGKLSERFVVSLKLLDVREAQVDQRLTESFVGLEDQLLPAVRQAATNLLGIERTAPGQLAVAASEPAAEVFIDEEERGSLPMPPLADLSAGKHQLRIYKEGFLDWRSDIYVNEHATTAVWAQLIEDPPEWYETWWFWSGTGALLVAGAATAYVVGTADDGGDTGFWYRVEQLNQ